MNFRQLIYYFHQSIFHFDVLTILLTVVESDGFKFRASAHEIFSYFDFWDQTILNQLMSHLTSIFNFSTMSLNGVFKVFSPVSTL